MFIKNLRGEKNYAETPFVEHLHSATDKTSPPFACLYLAILHHNKSL
jgi:hypothetical protein